MQIMKIEISEGIAQFIYRNINNKLVNSYCRLNHKKARLRGNRLISIIILSFNRFEDTKYSIKQLYKFSKFPFEVIVFDNNSDLDQLNRLRKYVKKFSNLRLIESRVNLGAAKGKAKAAEYAKGEYLFFMDNDIVVTPYFMENLMTTLLSDEKTVAVCSKVIFPNLAIQFNGGLMREEDEFMIFDLLDSGKLFWEKETLNNFIRCGWVPGGSTLWKADYYKKFPIDYKMEGSYEDNEVCVRINKNGYNVRNCPTSITIHFHMLFQGSQFMTREKRYIKGRYNKKRTVKALRRFWESHNKIFIFHVEEATYGFLKDFSRQKISEFIKNKDAEN